MSSLLLMRSWYLTYLKVSLSCKVALSSCRLDTSWPRLTRPPCFEQRQCAVPLLRTAAWHRATPARLRMLPRTATNTGMEPQRKRAQRVGYDDCRQQDAFLILSKLFQCGGVLRLLKPGLAKLSPSPHSVNRCISHLATVCSRSQGPSTRRNSLTRQAP